jgi:hypothetical protein
MDFKVSGALLSGALDCGLGDLAASLLDLPGDIQERSQLGRYLRLLQIGFDIVQQANARL